MSVAMKARRGQEVDAPSAPQKDRLSVLVADDEPSIRFVVGKLLERQGYEVLLAADGHEAIERTLAARPDAMILDFNLGDMDGASVLRELRAQGYDGGVIGLSGMQDPEIVSQLVTLGCVDLQTKPPNFGVLLTAVEAATAVKTGS